MKATTTRHASVPRALKSKAGQKPSSPKAPAKGAAPAPALQASTYDPILVEPYNAVAREQALWRAVIVQALMDAASGSKKKENIQAREEARVWLRGNSPDFLTVCHYAGYEPEFVREMVQEAMERDCVWRAAPGTGERARKNRAAGIWARIPTNRR